MQKKNIYIILSALATILMHACASIGNPQGGPYDETPPKVVRSFPDNKSTNNQIKRIRLLFDEYIKLENASEKVVISPPQTEVPEIRTEGKQITIELFDTLKENTTYTVDFSDAIVDNNEGNPMGHYTYSFSTGDKIDTMEVSGHVLMAENLEPIKGILVGLHPDTADNPLRKKAFLRVARTNGSGFFSIKGITPGRYHIYALQDADGDFRFSQKSEILAFDTITVIPECYLATRYDTVWHDSLHIDSIRMMEYTQFIPNDIILRAFKEDGQEQHLLKTERLLPNRFSVYFTAPADTLPVIKGFNFDEKNAFVPEASAHNDTITYWIPDTLIARMDTLHFSMTYMETDTAGVLTQRTDTLELPARKTYSSLLKDKQKKIQEWEKEREKSLKRGLEVNENNPYLKEYMSPNNSSYGTIAPNQNITITFQQPILKADTSLITFQKKVDTLWVDEPYLLLPVEGNIRSYCLYAEWEPAASYKFQADTAAFIDIFHTESNIIEYSINVNKLESYGALFVKLAIPDTQAVVQLLDASGKIIRTEKTKKNRADFFFLSKGKYYLRAFLDTNGNGIWDTGIYDEQKQPESMYYFPNPIPINALMEIEQEWNPTSIPLTKQKPAEITKQKPDTPKNIKKRNQNYNR